MDELEIYGDRPAVGTDVDLPHHHHRDRAPPAPRRSRDHPAGWIGLDADSRLGRLALPLAGPLSRRDPPAARLLARRGARARRPGHGPIAAAKAVWLEPPADMGRPVWRDVLEQTQLGPAERADSLASAGTERRRTASTLGADRRQGGRPAALARRGHAADLSGRPGDRRRPSTAGPQLFSRREHPAIARCRPSRSPIATASPSRSPRSIRPTRVGIDVETDRRAARELRGLGIHAARNSPLSTAGPAASRLEWVARFWCAKEAAAKATGLGLAAGPHRLRDHSRSTRTRASCTSSSAPHARRRRRRTDASDLPARRLGPPRRLRLGLDPW